MDKLEAGGGRVERRGSNICFTVPATTAGAYADAQWFDYAGLRRSKFPHRAPFRFSLQARFSHEADQLGGTAGFGLWNDPFTLSGGGVLAAPNTLWFFAASPPNDQYLCEGVPGRGWKAAALNTGRWPSLIMMPGAAMAILFARLPGLGRPIMKLARRMIKASEKMLEMRMTEWHEYAFDWRDGATVFRVDGAEVLRAASPPAGPLGLVIWIDNQYAVVSEAGQFKFGLIAHPEARWMEIAGLRMNNETMNNE